jgi:hypothetical protein
MITPPISPSVHHAAAPARHAIARFARWGYVSNSIVYFIVGSLAASWAAGYGGRITDAEGAMAFVRAHRYGSLLLAALAIGFFSYASWRILSAFDLRTHGARRVLGRIVAFTKGLVYGALGFEAIRLATDARRATSSEWAVAMLTGAWGESLVWIVGSIALVFGAHELYRGYAAELSDALALHEIRSGMRKWVVAISRFGIAARGVVIAVIGAKLIQTAIDGQPERARQATAALRVAARHSEYGAPIFAVIGVGLMAYAVYLLVLARYRRIEPA